MDELENRKKRTLLRQGKLVERDSLSDTEKHELSSRISTKLAQLDQVRKAETIFIYMHFRSEVRTLDFIKLCLLQGKTVTIPLTVPREKRLLPVRITDPEHDVLPGFYGIPEPSDQLLRTAGCNPNDIDITVIPGSVFDRFGGRLGYGGGYYDRFLVREAPRTFRIALAYEIQIVHHIPMAQHDQLMDVVVTEERIYDCRRNRHAQNSRLS
jgi:5-formyltetrahydrofolate cyclo-ligase